MNTKILQYKDILGSENKLQAYINSSLINHYYINDLHVLNGLNWYMACGLENNV